MNHPAPTERGSRRAAPGQEYACNAGSAPDRGKVCIVGRNPDALWFDGYEDRVLFDEAGLFEYSRVTNPALAGV